LLPLPLPLPSLEIFS